MTKDQNDRIVVAFELIAKSLGGLHEEVARAGKRYWPAPGEQREPVLSRVPNEEDEARRNLGISDGPIEDWLELDEPIGERTAQWLKDHPEEGKVTDAGPKVTRKGQEGGASTQEAKSKA